MATLGLTDAGRARISEIAAAAGVGEATAADLLAALAAGGGTQAQFNLPELGGMGQWSRGGMVMVGDMFNHGLKQRVDSLCNALSGLLGQPELFVAAPARGGGWWPADLGQPSSAGSQNDTRYAFFPGTRRLAIEAGGRIRIYDTGDHMISGVSQQQGSGSTLAFTSQHGTVRVEDLAPVGQDGAAAHAAPAAASTSTARVTSASASAGPASVAPEAPSVAEAHEAPAVAPVAAAPAASTAPSAPPPAPSGGIDVLATIERLAELRRKDILTEDEFAAKKADLLARL